MTYAGSVRLDYTDDAIDPLGRHAQAGADATNRCVRGRHEGVRADINIQERRIGTLHKDLVTPRNILVHHRHRIDDLRSQDCRILLVTFNLRLDVTDTALFTATLRVEGEGRVVVL